jgi:hypothetical protein
VSFLLSPSGLKRMTAPGVILILSLISCPGNDLPSNHKLNLVAEVKIDTDEIRHPLLLRKVGDIVVQL